MLIFCFQGDLGPTGAAGNDGPQGINGSPGPSGRPGQPGDQGAPVSDVFIYDNILMNFGLTVLDKQNYIYKRLIIKS